MKSKQPVRCGRCHEEIVPANIRTVYQMVDFHRHCFLLLVREEAEQQKRAEMTERSLAK
jgi:hypothetical protein